MSKEEKSILDELFDAAGLTPRQEKPAAEAAKEEKIEENESIQEKSEDISSVERVINEILSDNPKIKEEEPKEPVKEGQPKEKTEDHTTKKKDIKFLVIYTIVFVVVISTLIAGSYVISSRIHREMAESNQNLNTSQSTLQNIKDQNNALRQENAALKQENEALAQSNEDITTLLEGTGDMVEQDGYLLAAQNAFVEGKRTTAKEILNGIDRAKLSLPAQGYYDILKDKLES